MKLLLGIPVLLAFTFFNLPKEETLKEKESTLPRVEESVKIYKEEKITDTYSIQEEVNISEDEPQLIVEVPPEINITRDNPYTIKVEIKKSDAGNACNFFWSENGKSIGIGERLETTFPKGVHKINLTIMNGDNILKKIVTIKAWDYKKVQSKEFDKDTDEFNLMGETIYDHKNRQIKRRSSFATYSKVFNELDQVVEYKTEYHYFPEDSYIRYYSYDESGKELTVTRVKLDETPIFFQEFTYDEEGKFISSRSGIDRESAEEDIREDTIADREIIYYEDNISSQYPEVENNDKIIYNEDKQITYEEHDYGYVKEMNSYEYNQEHNLSKSIRKSEYSDKTIIRTSLFNEKRETIAFNFIEQKDEEVICNYSQQLTYNKKGQKATQNVEVLDGDCSQEYVETAYQEFKYNENGKIKNIISSENNLSKEKITLFKIVTFFSNTLEEE